MTKKTTSVWKRSRLPTKDEYKKSSISPMAKPPQAARISAFAQAVTGPGRVAGVRQYFVSRRAGNRVWPGYLDKARGWRALTYANGCGERLAFFFNHVYGNKERFHLCWRKLGQEYAMPPRGIHTLSGTMCQHDFEYPLRH